MNSIKYVIALFMVAVLSACGGGGGNPGTPSVGGSPGATTGGTTATTPLFTSAPTSLTLASGTVSPSYSISGGVSPYTAFADAPSLIDVAVSGTALTVTAKNAGAASVTITDSAGTKQTFAVTVLGPNTLFTTAPASLTTGNATSNFYSVIGGQKPYVVKSSNPLVVTATVNAAGDLTITGVASGTATVAISDSVGAVVSITVSVPASGVVFTDAPANLTLASGNQNTFAIYGGTPVTPVAPSTARYNLANSNTTVVNASISGTTLSVTGISAGTAILNISDATGQKTTVTVTVTATNALFTTAPSSLTVVSGQAAGTYVYAIAGGTKDSAGAVNYSVTSSNPAVVRVNTRVPTSQTFELVGVATGSASVVVADTSGNTVTIAVTVPAPVALFTTAPATLAISAGGGQRSFAIFGGASPYNVVNTNPAIASGDIPLGTSILNIMGTAVGSTSLIMSDAKGATVTIVVTVTSPGPLFTSAAASLTIARGESDTFSINGGSPSYSVGNSSNNSVATATMTDATHFKIAAGLTAGTATIVVNDSLNTKVSITVNVPAAGVLYTTAPGTLNITKTASPFSFAVLGGYPSYRASSSDPGIVSASVSVDGSGNSTLNISAVSSSAAVNGGTASVVVTDSQSQTVTIQVHVGSSTALFTNATPVGGSGAPIVLTVGSTYAYLVNGGTILENGGIASYWVTSTNSAVVYASFVGPVLTVVGKANGSGTIRVTDAVGATLDIAFTVGTGGGGGGGGGTASTIYPTMTPALQTSGGVATSSIDATSYTLLKVSLKDPSGVAIPNQVISVAGDLTKLSFPDGTAALTDATGVATIKIARANLLATGAGAITITYDYKPGMIASYSGGITPPTAASLVTTYVGYQVTTANISLTCLDIGAGCNTPATMKAYGTQQVSVIANINGVPATSTPVTVSFSATCGQVSPTTASTDSTGKVLVTYSATDASGTTPSSLGCSGKTVQVTASSSGAAAVSQSLTVTAAPATNMSFVSASPTRIYLANSGGVTQSIITFQLLNQLGEGIAGQSVQLTLKSLNGGTPKAAFDTLGSILPVTLTTDSTGKVSQPVYSGSVPTNVIVNAASVSAPSIQTDSAVLAIASGRPAQARLSLALEKLAIEGFNVDGTTTGVTLNLSDRQGNPVPDGTVVNFVTEGGVMIPPTCTTGTVAGNSSCSVTIRSQGTRPANGLVTILAYAAGEEDFTDTNGNNVYDCGEPFTDLGIAYRDNLMTSTVVNAYVPGEFTVPRVAETSGCGASVSPTPTSGDGVWGAADVRQQAVIVFATSAAVINQAGLTANSFTYSVADGNGNSMPTGSTIAVTTADHTPGNYISPCSVSTGASASVPNTLSPLVQSAFLTSCASGDSVLISVTSPLGLTTSQDFTIP